MSDPKDFKIRCYGHCIFLSTDPSPFQLQSLIFHSWVQGESFKCKIEDVCSLHVEMVDAVE